MVCGSCFDFPTTASSVGFSEKSKDTVLSTLVPKPGR
jgi:hypothetical protein